jgi:hypothetical protein
MIGPVRLDHCGAYIEDELNRLHAWYVAFGDALVNQRPVPPPHLRDRDGRRELFECVRAAVGSADMPSKQAALILIMAVQHLENLRRLEAKLGERANTARQTARSRATPLPRHAAP